MAKAVWDVGSFEEEEARKWQNNGSWQSLFYAGGYQNVMSVLQKSPIKKEVFIFGSNFLFVLLVVISFLFFFPLFFE